MKRAALGLVLSLCVSALLVLALCQPEAARAQDTQQVGLVVRFEDASVFVGCVDYTGSGMTGEDVLDASGLAIIKDTSYGLGAAICKMKADGCNYPQEHCFCRCQGADCEYWAYYHLDQQDEEWVYSGMGLSGHTVEPGDVEGWAWGNGEVGGSQVEPPVTTFEELCSSPAMLERTPEQARVTEESQPVLEAPQTEGLARGILEPRTLAFFALFIILILVFLRARSQF